MSKIISFSWTSAALLAGAKTVTRREWSATYGPRFKAGDLITAYDRLPRARGKPIAIIRLTHDARYEADADAPDSDYEAEGFPWLAAHPDQLPKSHRTHARVTLTRESFDEWRRQGGWSWVVRFELVEIVKGETA